MFVQVYDSNGIAVGNEFQVNSYTGGNQIYSSVCGLNDGGFLVSWASDGQDGSGFGVYGKKYGVDGAIEVDEFLINVTTDFLTRNTLLLRI